MNDHEALLQIQELLDGVEWTEDTTCRIARILERAGYQVHTCDGDRAYQPQPRIPRR